MISHCLQDNFEAFLDKDQYFLNATVFDAIGLKPGSAPRNRNLIGHRLYSPMLQGVGRGTIFNHRDPLHCKEDFAYTHRCVERFRRVLACTEPKLFVILNLNHKLWSESDLRSLFEELCQCTSNFLLLAVDCSQRNQGASALDAAPEELAAEIREGGRQLVMYRLLCAGDNTGSYFHEEADARRVRDLLVDPFRFDLAPDPLRALSDADAIADDTKSKPQPPLDSEEHLSVAAPSRWARNSAAQVGQQASGTQPAVRRWGPRKATSG